MKKYKIPLLIASIFLAFGVSLMGALAKLEHWPHANYLLIAGFLLQGIFIALAIYIISASYRQQLPERN